VWSTFKHLLAFVAVVNPPSRELYERIGATMNLDREPPPELLFHTASESNDDVIVVDVWESREAADDFATNRLMPAIASSGAMDEGHSALQPLYALEPFDEWSPGR
jgi:hypothetical protein